MPQATYAPNDLLYQLKLHYDAKGAGFTQISVGYK